MAFRLHQLDFKNFKFFKDAFPFKIEGKNVLLYGENGSGKSSIAMGLYTVMESRRKTIAEVHKYFTAAPDNDQDLRNKYSNVADDSSIKITFKDFSKPAPNPPIADKEYTISNTTIDTQDRTDSFLAYTTSAYDHFSYRTIGEYTYRKNSDKLDLFDVFLRDIFIFMKLREVYKVVNGIPQEVYALDRWKEITDTVLPMNGDVVDAGSEEYNQLHDKIVEFTEKINQNLYLIQTSANRYLSRDFEMGNVTIEVKMSEPVIEPSGTISKPSIYVTAHEVNLKIPGWQGDILHLATYFNEARLTCIGLALRLGISDSKLITNDNAPILCIDDVLLSMDMGYRLLVMKVFLKLTANRQLLIFTHDRAFYESMKNLLTEQRVTNEWKSYEMFITPEEISDKLYPTPQILEGKGDEEKAILYLQQCDYPTAANYLRKLAEKWLKTLLPDNMQLQESKDGEMKVRELRGLINGLSSFAKYYGFDITALPSLDFYRERILNPLSHNDIKTPVYRRELIECLTRIREIKALCDCRVNLASSSQSETNNNFLISVVKGGFNETLKFKVLEPWKCFAVEQPDHSTNRYYGDVLVRITDCNPHGIFEKEQRVSVYDLYNQLWNAAGYDKATAPKFDDVISRVNDGVLLKNV